jgi:hypothetical protein
MLLHRSFLSRKVAYAPDGQRENGINSANNCDALNLTWDARQSYC